MIATFYDTLPTRIRYLFQVIKVFADKMKEEGKNLYRHSFTSSQKDTIRTAFDELMVSVAFVRCRRLSY